MDETRYRRVTLVLLVLTAAFTAGVFALALVPYLRGLPVPPVAIDVAIGAAICGGLLGWFTFPARFVASLRERRRSGRPAPPDLTREAIALIASANRVWASDARYADSFALASLNILNELNGQIGRVPASAGVFIQEANGIVNGWRSLRPILDYLTKVIDDLSSPGVGMNENMLLANIGALYSLATAGTNLANIFAQAVANSLRNGATLSDYPREQWTVVVSRANLLAGDITKLAEKIRVTTGVDLKVYLSPVKGL